MKIRKNESVEQGVAPYGAQGAPPVNADVGSENNGLLRAQRTLHHSERKVSNHAGTIWESEARNSQ